MPWYRSKSSFLQIMGMGEKRLRYGLRNFPHFANTPEEVTTATTHLCATTTTSSVATTDESTAQAISRHNSSNLGMSTATDGLTCTPLSPLASACSLVSGDVVPQDKGQACGSCLNVSPVELDQCHGSAQYHFRERRSQYALPRTLPMTVFLTRAPSVKPPSWLWQLAAVAPYLAAFLPQYP